MSSDRSAAPRPSARQEADALVARATALAEQGQTSDALLLAERALNLVPRNASAHALAGTALHRLGRLDEALTHFRATVDLEPDSSPHHRDLAAVLFDLQRYAEAVAHAAALAAPQPQADYRDALGDLFADRGRFAEARTQHEAAVELDPVNPALHAHLANVLFDLERFDDAVAQVPEGDGETHDRLGHRFSERGLLHEARTQFQRAVDVDPANATYRVHLANALFDLALYDDAVAHLPDGDTFAHNLLGDRFRALGRPAAALARYQHAVDLEPDRATFQRDLAAVLFEIDRYDDAVAHAATLSTPQPQSDYRDTLGDLFRERARYEEALTQYRRAVELDPANSALRAHLCYVLFDLGRYDDAVEQVPADDGWAHDLLGDGFRNLGRLEQSLAQYRRAVDVDPENSTFQGNLANVLFDLQRYDDAVAQAPADDGWVHDLLGDRFREIGRYAQALAEYERAATLEPENATFGRDVANALFDLKRIGGAVES
ncbi:tetratricopeptide repeat protein [Pengzhenrongella sp.]|jgi:tetratricopeptide (TPR) repeat protein|uniref:tetratricopeptide repeat protein n=1 Tax=Pengzhenrongella sp. TaxID=2888820 RepID=UPI002F95622D